jgi:hypothetical protein
VKRSKSVKSKQIVMLSDDGELPGYDVDEYNDLIHEARQKLDRLCRFSGEQMENSVGSGDEVVDWREERAQVIKNLDRYSRQAFQVILKLAKLIHEVRDSRVMIERCDVEHAAKVLARRKRSKAELKALHQHERS